MNGGIDMKDGPGTDMDEDTDHGERADQNEDAGLDLQDASVILQEARDRARRGLGIRRPLLFASGGLAWLIGYGAIWLSVRGQRPYNGPTPTAAAVLILLVGAAVAITASAVGRAAGGVSGASSRQRRIAALSLVLGYAGVLTLEAALAHAGASRSVVHGVIQATAPIIVTGLVYIASSAVRMDWVLFGLGIWLVVVAAGSAFAGPVGVWAANALAGGCGFLLIAAIYPVLRPSGDR